MDHETPNFRAENISDTLKFHHLSDSAVFGWKKKFHGTQTHESWDPGTHLLDPFSITESETAEGEEATVPFQNHGVL